MKTLSSCFFFLFLAICVNAQFTVGPGGDAASLSEAFQAINAAEGDNGDVVLIITGDITEPAPAVLFESGTNGAFYNSITIYPQSENITISGDFDGPFIDLIGADNVVIDGRVNQSGGASLTLENINTGSSASTIRFSESAVNNIVQYCVIKGAGTGNNGGIISFEGASSGTGNDNNTIDNNKITRASSGKPVNALFSSGSAGFENSGNIVSNNEFFDHYNAGAPSCGINIGAASEGFSISGNSFYETTSFSPSGPYEYNSIKIDNTDGTGFSITGNFIGGKSVACGGTALTKTAGNNNVFNGIYFNGGISASSLIDGNVIRNITWSNSGNASWTGIRIESGQVLLGSTEGNFIGHPTNPGSVTVIGGASGTAVCGISVSGSGTISCTKNTVANIYNASASSGAVITGIYLNTSATSNSMDGSFIHHLTVSASSSSSEVYGIRINNGGSILSNNIISLSGNTPSAIYGVYESGTAGNNNSLYFNTIYIGGSSSAGNSYGLYSAANTNARNFRNNIIFNARSNGGTHYAMYIAVTGGTITCDYNDYYVSGTGGKLGYFGGDRLDIPIVDGQDANSIKSDPAFANAGGTAAADYIPATILSGVNGTTIITDYNGSERSSTSPTMGAIEVDGCINPTSGGIISLAEARGCTPFNPPSIAGTAPTGYTGVLEYKWQQSTTGSGSGFSDIPSASSASYDPLPLTQTTWVKRLSRVACSTDWTGAAESNVLELTVDPLPTASITGDLSACLSTTLTAVTDAASPEYIWYRDVSILSGETSSTLNVITTGPYKVTIKNGTTQCEQTSPAADVTINPQPTAVITGTLTACGSTTLTVTTDAASPSYSWFRDNAEIPGETGTTLNVLSSGLYKVKVKNGVTLCERTSTNKTVTINPLPSVSITGPLTACNSTILTAVTDAASPTYTWYRNDAVIAGVTSPTLNVTTSGDYKVKVRNGLTSCENTSVVSTVTLKTLPSITITGSLTGCGTTTLTAVTDASTPAFAWYKNNNLLAGETSGTLNVTASGDYKVKVTDGITTCENISSVSTVTINPLPEVSITGDLSVCVTTTLNAVTDASSPYYIWYKDGNIIDGQTQSTLQVTTPGDYKVKVVNGITTCRNTSAVATVTFNQPDAGLILDGSGNLCSGTSTSIVVNASEPGISYQLRNSSGNVDIGSPVTGTGGAINLPAGDLLQTTTFNVLASNISVGCSVLLIETETVTVEPPSEGGTITGGISPVSYGNSIGTLTLGGYTGNIVKWQKMVGTGSWDDITNTSATWSEIPSSAGTWQYRAIVKNGICPEAFSAVRQIIVNKADQTITLSPLPDKILVGETFTLTATSSANMTVFFESLDSDIASVTGNVLTGVSKGKATIRAYNDGDQNYNAAEATEEIKVHSTHSKIMNLFTPNNDGINDYWELPDMPEWGKCDVKVYNRWGKLVFANPDYDNLWDGVSEGSPLPEGAYYYIIKTQNSGVVKGTVNLVR